MSAAAADIAAAIPFVVAFPAMVAAAKVPSIQELDALITRPLVTMLHIFPGPVPAAHESLTELIDAFVTTVQITAIVLIQYIIRGNIPSLFCIFRSPQNQFANVNFSFGQISTPGIDSRNKHIPCHPPLLPAACRAERTAWQ